MAKGSATEDDLAAGIRSVGVLSAVTASEGIRRDNPFATSPVRPRVSLPERVAGSPEPERLPPLPVAAPTRKKLTQNSPKPSIEERAPEYDTYTDFVTVPMTAEMRTQANLLAAELQRRRTEKRVRFTPNTIFRVAIETFLERFELAPEDHVNSEEDLLLLVHERITASKRTKSPTS
jgi:hypothetical protein